MLFARTRALEGCMAAGLTLACAPVAKAEFTAINPVRALNYHIELSDCESSASQDNEQLGCFDANAHAACSTEFGEITSYCDQRSTISSTRIAGWGFAAVDASQIIGESDGFAQSGLWIRFRLDTATTVRLRADINGHNHPHPMPDFSATVQIALIGGDELYSDYYASRESGRLRPDQVVQLPPGDYEFNVEALVYGSDDVHFSGFGTWQVSLAVADCPSDVNNDGVTDLEDVAHVVADYGRPIICDQSADIDQDGLIRLSDLTLVLAGFGETCPP